MIREIFESVQWPRLICNIPAAYLKLVQSAASSFEEPRALSSKVNYGKNLKKHRRVCEYSARAATHLGKYPTGGDNSVIPAPRIGIGNTVGVSRTHEVCVD
jgi:hypothetical protein